MSPYELRLPGAGGSPLSKRLLLSYLIDWAFILLIVGVGRIMKVVEPARRPFSLADQTISYPFAVKERVPVAQLVVASLIVPAVAIAIFSLLVVPGPAGKRAFGANAWRRKLWEWNAGWMGLGVAFAGTYAATEAMKIMLGKPRPDMLDRCDPNLSDIASHVVGGLGGKVSGAPLLVTWTICKNKSENLLRDGFVSFPSGHSSMSFAGLTYLSLWICAKFAITIPYLPSCRTSRAAGEYEVPGSKPSTSLRHRGAAPPAYLLTLLFAPIVGATYIATSRYADNRHFGFDIIFGSVMGIAFAWLGFRMYHLPLSSGQGWAWGARDKHRAFYGTAECTSYAPASTKDVLDLGNLGPRSPGSLERNGPDLLAPSEGRSNEPILNEQIVS